MAEKSKNEQVLALLNEQVVEQTLSLQGVEKVKGILAENADMVRKITMLENAVKEGNAENTKLRNELDKTSKELTVIKTRNGELEAKEKLYYEQSVKFSYEAQRGNEMKEIVNLALRNPIITKSRFESGSIPVAVEGSGNGCMGMVYPDQKTSSLITETTEEK